MNNYVIITIIIIIIIIIIAVGDREECKRMQSEENWKLKTYCQ